MASAIAASAPVRPSGGQDLFGRPPGHPLAQAKEYDRVGTTANTVASQAKEGSRMYEKGMDPLQGHCLCDFHARRYRPRRATLRFFFIPPSKVPPHMLCGRCAPEDAIHGGLVVSQESLDKEIVTFIKTCAVDLRALKRDAIPLSEWSRTIPLRTSSPFARGYLKKVETDMTQLPPEEQKLR